LRRLAPRIPPHEFAAVVDHAVDSSGLRSAEAETAAWLSLVAYVRHVFTGYDALLREGYDRDSARFFVAGEIDAVLRDWAVWRRRTEAQLRPSCHDGATLVPRKFCRNVGTRGRRSSLGEEAPGNALPEAHHRAPGRKERPDEAAQDRHPRTMDRSPQGASPERE